MPGRLADLLESCLSRRAADSSRCCSASEKTSVSRLRQDAMIISTTTISRMVNAGTRSEEPRRVPGEARVSPARARSRMAFFVQRTTDNGQLTTGPHAATRSQISTCAESPGAYLKHSSPALQVGTRGLDRTPGSVAGREFPLREKFAVHTSACSGLYNAGRSCGSCRIVDRDRSYRRQNRSDRLLRIAPTTAWRCPSNSRRDGVAR